MVWAFHVASLAFTLLQRPMRPPHLAYRALATSRSRVNFVQALDGSPASSVATSDAPIEPLMEKPNGFLLVHKPQNWTSFDVVGKVRYVLERRLKAAGHKFGRKSRLKVGHGGTLDPMATGLLVLGVGNGTKRMGALLKGSKAYVARAQLGAETDTQDKEGEVTTTAPHEHVTVAMLESAAAELTGDILQRPPIYSALRKDGKRLHELARAGQIKPEDVEKRPVTVHHLGVHSFDAATGVFALDVKCSGGTYVRALIEDIGRAVGSAAHMTALERTRHGPFCNDVEAAAARALGDDAHLLVAPVFEGDLGSAEKLLQAVDEANGALATMPTPAEQDEDP